MSVSEEAKRLRPGERGGGPATKQARGGAPSPSEPGVGPRLAPKNVHEARKKERAQGKKRSQDSRQLQSRITDLEARIAGHEQAIRDLEAAMSAPGFYENRVQAQPVVDRHQTLMWEVGELMHQWEELQRKSLSITETDAT